MTLIITENINPADQEELLAGLREFNLRFLDPAQFGELGVYSRDDAGASARRVDRQTQGQLAVY